MSLILGEGKQLGSILGIRIPGMFTLHKRDDEGLAEFGNRVLFELLQYPKCRHPDDPLFDQPIDANDPRSGLPFTLQEMQSRVGELERQLAAMDGSIDCGNEPCSVIGCPCKKHMHRELREVTAERDRLRQGRLDLCEACREALQVVDEAYQATGYIKIAETSEQRLRIEAAMKETT